MDSQRGRNECLEGCTSGGHPRYLLCITRKEAVEIIALLTGQLGDVTSPGCQSGACPTLWVDIEGKRHSLGIILDDKEHGG